MRNHTVPKTAEKRLCCRARAGEEENLNSDCQEGVQASQRSKDNTLKMRKIVQYRTYPGINKK